jgi:hypothetical protein
VEGKLHHRELLMNRVRPDVNEYCSGWDKWASAAGRHRRPDTAQEIGMPHLIDGLSYIRVLLALAVLMMAASAEGRAAGNCSASPPGRPVGWSRVAGSDLGNVYLDFGSFCRVPGSREVSLLIEFARPMPFSRALTNGALPPPVRSRLERRIYSCGAASWSIQTVDYYVGPFASGEMAAHWVPTSPERLTDRPGTVEYEVYSVVCDRDDLEDVVWGMCSYGRCASLNVKKYGDPIVKP